MDTIKYNDILNTYQRIDLYRAKYRHSDFTLHAWCFHGNEEQNWTGSCLGGFLRSTTGFTYNAPIAIDASTYVYLSFRFATPEYAPAFKRYKLTMTYTTGAEHTKEIIVRYNGQLTTVFADLSGESDWTGTVTRMSFALSAETATNTWAAIPAEVNCEYIKFDKDNVFANVLDKSTVTIVDLNEMRGDVETFAGEVIDWTGDDRVKQFVSAIKKSDIDEVNARITLLDPYNGCSTCDNFQCTCDTTDYGHIPCQTCNTCNQYSACSSCDQTCHEQTRSCACNNICYTQPSGCGCDSTCYGYSSCTCDGSCHSCYSGNVVCTQCDSSGYYEWENCMLCDTCYCYTCKYEHTDTHTDCSYCYVRSDSGCSMTYSSSCGSDTCNCDSSCYEYEIIDPDPEWACAPSCYVESCVCHGGDSSYRRAMTRCTICYGCNTQQASCSSCYVGYGDSGCSTCNSTCYSQATACSCNSTCYLEARSCTCNNICNAYQACVTCDGCDLYQRCACDQTCFSESCEQCHKAGYSSVQF